MFIITFVIFIPITQQPEQDRLAENQPTASLGILNEYENGMIKLVTELENLNYLVILLYPCDVTCVCECVLDNSLIRVSHKRHKRCVLLVIIVPTKALAKNGPFGLLISPR